MCGILAVVGRSLPDQPTVDAALDRMRHRGPDDGGCWRDGDAVMGARRLAIIDLGPGGYQPMVSSQSGAVLVFNGEIYNHIELRRELAGRGHRFTSASDTEVLLRAWEEWGADCLRRLNGMWAFVVWDPRSRTAFFARDRFGVKPLYFAMVDDVLAVGSEPKVLLEIAPKLRRPDEAALYAFLADGTLYGHSRSFYAGVGVLAPGSCGTFASGWSGPRIQCWWRLPPVDPASDTRDEEEAVDRFAEVFEDATRLRLRSDVPVGVTLSGGLDSTAVLHAARGGLAAERTLRAYTAVYTGGGRRADADMDERSWAQIAREPYESVDLRMVETTPDAWMDILRRIVWHMDAPGYSPAVLPLWHIAKTARADGVPVLLEGQGADELLGGYARHVALAFIDALAGLIDEPHVRQLRRVRDVMGVGVGAFSVGRYGLEVAAEAMPALRHRYLSRRGALGALRKDWVRSLAAPVRIRRRSADGHAPTRSRLEDGLREDFTQRILPGFLHYGDAISMAHSVETRLPFLDVRVVELCARLPPRLKIDGGGTKRILRQYLRRAGQERIGGRPDKRGFPTPVNRWLAADNGALAREVLLAPAARVGAYASRASMGRLIDDHVAGRLGPGDHLYRLLTTELWLQECLTP